MSYTCVHRSEFSRSGRRAILPLNLSKRQADPAAAPVLRSSERDYGGAPFAAAIRDRQYFPKRSGRSLRDPRKAC